MLDPNLNNQASWASALAEGKRRTEVDLHEVEHVIQLARWTPGLSQYDDELQDLSKFFSFATAFYQSQDPNGLTGLVEFWERYRSAVVQRHSGVTPVELRSADKVVKEIFSNFMSQVPLANKSYSDDAVPLVFGGDGGTSAYYTNPPGWNRPFAIINLPHTAFDVSWQWLALAHETGHDTYASVNGLAAELEAALEAAMHQAVDSGNVNIPSVNITFSYGGQPYTISYSGREFLAAVWRAWANESQADIVGLLSCGGASTVALQQIIGFSANDSWEMRGSLANLSDGPEVHPTSYVRNALNIAALRMIDGGRHTALADEIQTRFTALGPAATHINWSLEQTIDVASVPVAEMVRSAEIAADVLLNHKLAVFDNKSYSELISFSAADQAEVESMVQPLLDGDPTFAGQLSPRHALAATIFAYERDSSKAETINRTFQHFV